MNTKDLILHIISQRKWRNGYLIPLANAAESGEDIRQYVCPSYLKEYDKLRKR